MRNDARANSPRRRGRPPLSDGEQTFSLTVSVPASLYDQLAALAQTRRVDLAPLIRIALREFARLNN